MLGAFGKGLIIGFSVAAPIGPLGILLIRRTLTLGRICGIMTGLGIATADLIYAAIAAFGVSFLMDFLINQQILLHSVGALFLTYLAIKIFITKIPKASDAEDKSAKAILSAYFSTFVLTLADPMTILAFTAIFSSFCLEQQGFHTSLLLVLGVFCGALIWFCTLSEIVYYFREKFTDGVIKVINVISGIILLGFAALATMSAIYQICFVL